MNLSENSNQRKSPSIKTVSWKNTLATSHKTDLHVPNVQGFIIGLLICSLCPEMYQIEWQDQQHNIIKQSKKHFLQRQVIFLLWQQALWVLL